MTENIKTFASEDAEMDAASSKARQTFRYFWRELSWENRRIIPGLDVAMIKVGFSDEDMPEDGPSVEHMWVGDVHFDGAFIYGALNSDPNWVSSVKNGDAVKIPLEQLSDWIFVCAGRAYGGYTVNLIRSRMSGGERAQHDAAWGVEFGNPKNIQVVSRAPVEKVGLLRKLMGKKPRQGVDEMIEHPMSINMGVSLREALAESDELLKYVDEEGNTLMHTEALAGNVTGIKIMLEHGMDKSLKNQAGQTPLDMAKIFNWDHVKAVLQ